MDELQARVRLVEPNIVVLRELPIGAAEALVVMTDKVRALVDPRADWALVIDLVDSAGHLPGEYRRFIPSHLSGLGASHIAMALYSNLVVRSLSRFVARSIGLNVTVHKDTETAIAAVRAALQRGRG